MPETILNPSIGMLGAPAGRSASAGSKLMLCIGLSLALAGCAQLNPSAPPRLDETGASVQGIYPVTMENIVQIRARAEATVNNTRTARGLAPVTLDSALVAAADSHSRSMAQQRRAWHFGADGSSPMDRARRAGFVGEILGELVSETYESEVQAIATWMGSPAQRAVLLDPMARRIGMGVFQEPNNKLWWTLTVAN
ncbi:CAP domain-containing protein [Celeribacter indicus]|nr:CAP domain-containing protein [Celeribacter indicus]